MAADHAALSFELWRLVQENDMLRARTGELENDVRDLIETSENLGHANPKQKLQYHMRLASRPPVPQIPQGSVQQKDCSMHVKQEEIYSV